MSETIEIQDLGRSVTEQFDDMNRRINEAQTQVQRLQGAGGLLEPLSNVVGYQQVGLNSVDPTTAVATVAQVTFIGQAQILLAGEGITFDAPSNSPYLRISMTDPNMCYDAIVDPGGLGSHTTLAAAITTALAASGTNFTILICDDITEAATIDIGGIDKTIFITGLVPASRRTTINSSDAEREGAPTIRAATSADLFTQTSNKAGTDRGLIFSNLGLMTVNGKAIYRVAININEIDFLGFTNCYFSSVSGRGFIATNGLDVLMPMSSLDISLTDCSGVIDAFFENNSTPPDGLYLLNNRMDITKWWTNNDAADEVYVEGGHYVVTNAQTIEGHGNHDTWTFKSLTIQTGCSGAAFRHSATDTNAQGPHFSDILFLATANDTDFGDFQSPVANPYNNVYVVNIHGTISSGVVPIGTFLTVDSDNTNVYVADIHAPDWPTVYSGPVITPSVPPVVDHGALTGLTDDDHTQYLLADGTRPLTGNWSPGVFDIGNFDYTSKALLSYAGDALFVWGLVVGNPIILFDTTDSFTFTRVTNTFDWNISSLSRMSLASGQLSLSTTGSSAGLLLGGDAQWYRSAVDVMRTPDALTVDGAVIFSSTLTMSGDIIMADETFIRTGTSDGTDNASTGIAGGGALSSIRGSFVRVSGNEDANTGKLFLTAGNVTGGEIRLSTGGAARVTIDANGLVGFGLTAPQKDLHISSAVPTIRLSDSNAGTDQAVATLIEFYRGENTNRIGLWGMASGSNDIMALATDYAAGEIRFATSSNVFAMTIDSSQNVGIGTTSPDMKLTVNGDVNIRSGFGFVVGHTAQIDFGAIPEFQVLGLNTPSSSMGFARFENNASGPDVRFLKSRGITIGSNIIVQNNDTLGRFRFQGADGGDFNTTAAEVLTRVDGVPGLNNIPGIIAFRTRLDGGALADKMTIDNAGQLAVPITGSAAGLLLGADVHLYRGAANLLTLASGDSLNLEQGYIQLQDMATPAVPATGDMKVFARVNGSNIQLIGQGASGAECIICNVSNTPVPPNTLALNWIE